MYAALYGRHSDVRLLEETVAEMKSRGLWVWCEQQTSDTALHSDPLIELTVDVSRLTGCILPYPQMSSYLHELFCYKLFLSNI